MIRTASLALLLFGAACAQAFEDDEARIELAAQRRNPPGNYADTCNLCDWNDQWFHCRCDKIDGTWIETGLYYNQECKYHTLQNIDGHLRCDPTIAPEFRR